MSEDLLGEESAAGVAEPLLTWAAALTLTAGLALLSLASALVFESLYALVAAVFFGTPWLAARIARREHALIEERPAPPLWRGIAWGLGASLLTLAPFLAGQYLWETHVMERRWAFDTENWRSWPAEYEGEPAGWAEEERGPSGGAAIWTQGGQVWIGARGERGGAHTLWLEAPGYDAPVVVRGEARVREGGDGVWEIIAPVGRGEARIRTSPRPGAGAITLRSERAAIETGAGRIEPNERARLARGWSWLALWALTQLAFIALPEEYFYRGYLQGWLERAWRGRRLGPLSAANAATSALFALGHWLVPIGGALIATRLSVFFPSLLFGWLKERTGSLVAPVIYHAACNMMVIAAAVHYR